MIQGLFDRIILPVALPIVLKRHGGIWGLKRHLVQNARRDPRLVRIYYAYLEKFGSWIGLDARFDGTPCFPHGCCGVFISGDAALGKNVVVFHQVTIGSNTLDDSAMAGAPVIGNDVYIGAGAKIIGRVVVGDHCRIGANAVVCRDMPPHSVAVPAPTRFIQKANLDNRFYSRKPDGRRVCWQDGGWVDAPEKTVQTGGRADAASLPFPEGD